MDSPDMCSAPDEPLSSQPEPEPLSSPALTPAGGPAPRWEPPAAACERPASEWRGNICEAARQAEASGVTAFTSADWQDQSSMRVMTPEELACTAEAANASFAPGVEPPKVYTLGQDGTIYNTATDRAEYVPVREKAPEPLACEAPAEPLSTNLADGPACVDPDAPAAPIAPLAAPEPAHAPPPPPDRGVLGKIDDALGKAHDFLQSVHAPFGPDVPVPTVLGSPMTKPERDAIKSGIHDAAHWLHNRIDDVVQLDADWKFGKDTTVGNIYAAATSAPAHLVVDAAAGLLGLTASTPTEVLDDAVQSHRGAVRGLETALDPTKPVLERVEGGATAVAVASGDILAVAGGVELAAATRAPAVAVTEAAAARAPAVAVTEAAATRAPAVAATEATAARVATAAEARSVAIQKYWPLNDGFVNTPTVGPLPSGYRFSRYGGFFDDAGAFRDFGNYTAPVGVPVEMRAIPAEVAAKPLTTYEVVKPIPNVRSGPAAPAFGEIGLGTQHQLPMTIQDYLDQGYIRIIDQKVPAKP